LTSREIVFLKNAEKYWPLKYPTSKHSFHLPPKEQTDMGALLTGFKAGDYAKIVIDFDSKAIVFAWFWGAFVPDAVAFGC
jgi:hypothetical protein